MGRQTVGDLIEYLLDADCCEGMTKEQVLAMPVSIHTNGCERHTILSVYSGGADICIDVE